MPPTQKTKRRSSFIPAECPKCGRAIRRFRTIRAEVLGALVKKLEAAHIHLTFAGVCGGMHLHICAACDAKLRTVDSECNWSEPTPFQPGWTAAKADQCECEDAIEVKSESAASDKPKPS